MFKKKYDGQLAFLIINTITDKIIDLEKNDLSGYYLSYICNIKETIHNLKNCLGKIEKKKITSDDEHYINKHICGLNLLNDIIYLQKIIDHLRLINELNNRSNIEENKLNYVAKKIYTHKDIGCFYCEVTLPINIYSQYTYLKVYIHDIDLDLKSIDFTIKVNLMHGLIDIIDIKIAEKHRHKGYGTAIFKQIDEVIDQYNSAVSNFSDLKYCIPITLANGIISPRFGMELDKLNDFYKKVGYYQDGKIKNNIQSTEIKENRTTAST